MLVAIVFVGLLLLAALSDVSSYRIPNIVVAGLVLLFAVTAVLNRSQVPWTDHLGAAGLSLVVGLPMYYFGKMGAGDVKLFCALALWTGFATLVPFMFFVAIAGVMVMLLILSARYGLSFARKQGASPFGGAVPRVLQHGEGIPFGAAICIGAAATIQWFPTWLWS